MDEILQQLLTLVAKGTIEQRCATLVVLGALKLDNAAVVKTVGAALHDSNAALKDHALRYFEIVQPRNAVPVLLELLEDSDKEIQERGVRLLGAIGQPSVQPLVARCRVASLPWRLNAAHVLSKIGGNAALHALLKMLSAGTDEFNKALCDLLTPAIREMNQKEQDSLYDKVEAFSSSLEVEKQKPAAISAMRLLGQLGRPQARRWLFKFIAPEFHASLRSHALIALLRCLREQELRKEEFTGLFPLFDEAEFSEVTRLGLDLLSAHELPDDARPLLSRLMQSPHPEVQKFALRKMGDFSTPATVRTLIEQLGDPDYRRRDVAAGSLRKIPGARAALIKELIECDNASKAWSIAELLPSFDGKWRRDNSEALWKRLQAAIAAEDRIQTAFLHVLKLADADYAYEQLAGQGARLCKAKKYKEAVGYLTLLKEFSGCNPEHKFLLALGQLKLHAHTVASHRQHPAVELLVDLYRNSAFPLFDALKKEKSLAPEELFAVGFSLAERPGAERALGKDLLEHIATRFPRNKIGKSAKNKLKLASQ